MILLDGFRDNVIGYLMFDVIIDMIEKHVRHVSWRQMRGYFQEAGFIHIRQRKRSLLFPQLLTVGVRPAARQYKTQPVDQQTADRGRRIVAKTWTTIIIENWTIFRRYWK